QPASWRPVELPTPSSVLETPFSFSQGGVVMQGTLAVPRSVSGRMPVVVMVAGSGPTDRNGNGPLMSLNTNTYAMLAWSLADRGIASLRYDKRGIGQSAVANGDPAKLSADDFIDDVAAAVASLTGDSRFSKVFLLGHSEGAGFVLQAANRGARVAGVIMVEAQGRQLAAIMHEQFGRQTDSSTLVKIDSALARYFRGEDPGDVPAIARPLIPPQLSNYWRSFAAYDPPDQARRYRGPLLIVQGTTDIQVTMQDAELLAAAQPRATLLRL